MNNKGLEYCKYLSDLGIPIESYGTNFCNNEDDRWEEWMTQRETYGFDERETWGFHDTFIEWLYTHLMMFKEKAEPIVDLTFYKFPYDENEDGNTRMITLGEAIDIIIEACRNYLTDDDAFANFPKKYIYLLADILPALWW